MVTSIADPEVQGTVRDARGGALQHPPVPFQVILDGQPAQVPPPFPSPQEWRDKWIYFLMIDRFNNAQPGHTLLHPPYDSITDTFQGGKFNGVRAQLPYLRNLGVEALWLSPVIKNCQFDEHSYHGYGIQDFLRVDPRFADNPNAAEHELRALIDEAHRLGMYVIFDIVVNHTGDVFAYRIFDHAEAIAPFNPSTYLVAWRDPQGVPQIAWERPEDAPRDLNDTVWPEELRHNESFHRQGRIGLAPDVGDFESLKDLRTDHPQVRGTLIRAYQYLIAKYDVDGFRIDTLRHISPDFARVFANAIREFALTIGKKNFFIFGEVAGSERDIAAFIGRSTTTPDGPIGADAALDFPLFSKLPGVVKGFLPPTTVAGMYEERKQVEQAILSTHGDASNFFVTFLDNHDQRERFYFVPADPAHAHDFDAQVTLGLACLFTLQGIPCVYYGTEQGLHGRGDKDQAVREALWGAPNAFDQGHPFYQATRQLAQLRDNQPALRYGRQYFRPLSGDRNTFALSSFAPGVLAFSRILSDQEIVVAANMTRNQQPLAVIVDFSLNTLLANFNILHSNIPTPIAPGPVQEIAGGNCTIFEVNGSVNHGPVRYVEVILQPMEIQILGR